MMMTLMEPKFWQYLFSLLVMLAFTIYFSERRYSLSKTCAIAGICFVLIGVGNWIMLFGGVSEGTMILITILTILVTQGTVLWINQYRDFRGLFTGITGAAYVLVGSVCWSLIHIFTGNDRLALLVQAGAYVVLFFTLGKFLRQHYFEELRHRKTGWGSLCLVPALFYAAVYTLVVWPTNIYTVPTNGLGTLMVLLILFIDYALIFQILSQNRKELSLLRANDYLQSYTKHLERESGNIRKGEEATAILRHDMRHRVRIIDSYLKMGQVEQARDVLRAVEESLDAVRVERYCENSAINGVVSYLAVMAAESNITLTTALEIPEDLAVPEFELATVISNLLENAVEGAAQVMGDRWVRITANRFKGRLVFEIRNTCSSQMSTDGAALPPTSKGDGHGLGLQSVLAFTKRYDAAFDYTVESGVFIVRLMV